MHANPPDAAVITMCVWICPSICTTNDTEQRAGLRLCSCAWCLFSCFPSRYHHRCCCPAGTRILSYLPAYKCLDSASNCIRGTPNLAYLSGTSMATPIISAQVAMCYEKGLCSSEAASEASKITRATYNYNKANRSYGYKGDPLNRPIAGKYYGYLVYGNAF